MSASTTRPVQYSALQTGWFKEVRVKDLDGHSVRALLASRELLVKIKRGEPRSCDRPCQVQCLCRTTEELIENRPELIAVVGPLLKARQAIEQYGYHLHHFEIGGLLYGDATSAGEFGDREVLSEPRLKLGQLVKNGERQFSYSYVYDYGDNWWCSVVLEVMYPAIQGIPYPCLDGGAEAGPPEESGGVWGVEELVGALRDPRHERHEEAVEHLGEDYNPEVYDADATAQALAALVKRPTRSRKKTSPTIEN